MTHEMQSPESVEASAHACRPKGQGIDSCHTCLAEIALESYFATYNSFFSLKPYD